MPKSPEIIEKRLENAAHFWRLGASAIVSNYEEAAPLFAALPDYFPHHEKMEAELRFSFFDHQVAWITPHKDMMNAPQVHMVVQDYVKVMTALLAGKLSISTVKAFADLPLWMRAGGIILLLNEKDGKPLYWNQSKNDLEFIGFDVPIYIPEQDHDAHLVRAMAVAGKPFAFHKVGKWLKKPELTKTPMGSLIQDYIEVSLQKGDHTLKQAKKLAMDHLPPPSVTPYLTDPGAKPDTSAKMHDIVPGMLSPKINPLIPTDSPVNMMVPKVKLPEPLPGDGSVPPPPTFKFKIPDKGKDYGWMKQMLEKGQSEVSAMMHVDLEKMEPQLYGIDPANVSLEKSSKALIEHFGKVTDAVKAAAAQVGATGVVSKNVLAQLQEYEKEMNTALMTGGEVPPIDMDQLLKDEGFIGTVYALRKIGTQDYMLGHAKAHTHHPFDHPGGKNPPVRLFKSFGIAKTALTYWLKGPHVVKWEKETSEAGWMGDIVGGVEPDPQPGDPVRDPNDYEIVEIDLLETTSTPYVDKPVCRTVRVHFTHAETDEPEVVDVEVEGFLGQFDDPVWVMEFLDDLIEDMEENGFDYENYSLPDAPDEVTLDTEQINW